jgi:hypothetical protein
MSSIFDIVISFIAALIAAAFAHFGASEIPVGRGVPASTPPEASSYAPPVTEVAPVSAPQPPSAPLAPQPISDIHSEPADAEADHMAAIAERAEYEAEMSAHEADMKLHEAQMKAFEAQIEAAEMKAHARPTSQPGSRLSFRHDGKSLSGVTVTLPQSFATEPFNIEAFTIPPIDLASVEAAKAHAQQLELVAQAACAAAAAERARQMMDPTAHPSGDIIL